MASSKTNVSSATPEVETDGTDVPNSGHVDIREVITDAMHAFGSPKTIVDGIDSALDKVATANNDLSVWFKVAVATKTDGTVTAREFGELTSTDKNYLGRLISAGLLWKVHVDKGLTLTPRDAFKVANVKSGKDILAIVAEVRKGRDPLNTKGGKVRPNANAPRKGRNRPGQSGPNVDPKDYARVLEFIVANVDKASDDSKRRLLTSAMALADILTSEGVAPIDLDIVDAEVVDDSEREAISA